MSRNPRADRNWQASWLARERSGDFAHSLSLVTWDTFNTLTFQNPIPPERVCFGMAFRWCRDVSKFAGVPYNRLLIALRGEYGEQKGRFHFHCLIGGTTTRNTKSLSHASESLWRNICGGIAESRPYQSSLAGAQYICKCLGANEYELGKFNSANSVTLSDSVFNLFRGTASSVDRRLGKRQVTKAAGVEPATVDP
jgi:hypothetical protein